MMTNRMFIFVVASDLTAERDSWGVAKAAPILRCGQRTDKWATDKSDMDSQVGIYYNRYWMIYGLCARCNCEDEILYCFI